MKRRIEITTLTEQIFIRRPRPRSAIAWCTACAAEVRMATPEEAATLTGISRRTIYRWLEAGRMHFSEQPGEPLLICLDSLRVGVESR